MLATISEVKTHIGLSVSTYDAVLTQILKQVDAHIKSMLARDVEAYEYSDDVYDGDTEFIQLKNYPIDETADFTFEYNANDSADPDWTTVPRDDYEIYYDVGVIFMNSVYNGRRVLRLTYTAGEDTVPYDLQMLVVRLVAKIYNKRKSEGTSNESLENVNFGWQNLISPEDQAVIDNHKMKFFV